MDHELSHEEVEAQVNHMRLTLGCNCHPDIFVAALPFGGNLIQLKHEDTCIVVLRRNAIWN